VAFELDLAGGAEVLKEMSAAAIADLAAQVAAAAGDGAVVDLKTTDRAKAFVRVPAEQQAKDGLLSRAAAEVGLEVRPSKKRPPKKKRGDKQPPSAKQERVQRKRGRPRKGT
jgi:hypothetical protein